MKECVATAKFMIEKKKLTVHMKRAYIYNAPVICIPGPLGTGDTRDIAGLKYRNLTYDVFPQCRGCAGGLIGLNRPLMKEFV